MAKTVEVHPYADKWDSLCKDIDRLIGTPVGQGNIPFAKAMDEVFGRFGIWEEMRDTVQNYILDEQYYQNQYEDMEKEKEEAEENLEKLKEATEQDIQEVMQDLDNIDCYAQISSAIDADIQKVYAKLAKIEIGERINEPVAKRKKKK